MDTLVFASNNPAKIVLVKKMLENLPLRITVQREYNVPDVVEDKTTFIENAILKARNASNHTHLPAIADDSGILVPSLENKPGVRTNRYAGEGKTREHSVTKLLSELKGMTGEDRIARFICTMVFFRNASDPSPLLLQHEMVGKIAEQPQGQGQYGFDSIFYLPAYGLTFAQLEPEIRDREDPRTYVLKELAVHLRRMISPLQEGITL